MRNTVKNMVKDIHNEKNVNAKEKLEKVISSKVKNRIKEILKASDDLE